jgi:hypothetical protein
MKKSKHFVKTFFFKCAVRDVRKCSTARQAKDDNKILQRKGEIGMPDTEKKYREYRHAFIICNAYFFSIAILVTSTRLNVTLFIHFLPCSLLSLLTEFY